MTVGQLFSDWMIPGSAVLFLYVLIIVRPNIFGINRDRLERWTKHTARQAERASTNSTSSSHGESLKKMSVEDYKKGVSGGRLWTVLDGFVLDLARMNYRHPGGDFLYRFTGRDVTPWFLCQHGKNEKILKIARHCTIAELQQNNDGEMNNPNLLQCQADQEYMAMHQRAARDGVFDVKRAWIVRDAIESLVPSIIGLGLYHEYSGSSAENSTGDDDYDDYQFAMRMRMVALFSIAVGAARVIWWFHDISHYSVFPSTQQARMWVQVMCIVLLGFDVTKGAEIHAVHHAFPNIIGLDSAIEMPIIKVHPSQGVPAVPQGGQNAIFYGVLAWLALPYYATAGVVANLKNPVLFVVLSTRMIVTIYFWNIFHPLVYGTIFGFVGSSIISSLNHFQMDMAFADDVFPPRGGNGLNNKNNNSKRNSKRTATITSGPSFVVLQTQTVSNTHSNWFTDLVTGHLTMHIEHHLFPHAPRQNYHKLTAPIKDLFSRYEGLRYHDTSQLEAITAFNRVLTNPTKRHPMGSVQSLCQSPKHRLVGQTTTTTTSRSARQ